jgi:NAD(P)-dependent dehydrogenase (short-subunit alcohol dehydrogenase family)
VDKGLKAVADLNIAAEVFHLDINDAQSIIEFAEKVKKDYGRVDVLVNNAAIMGDKNMLEFDLEQMRNVLETNFWGAVTLTKHLFPLLKKSDDARIINVSSGMGEMSGMQSGGYAAYRMSKWMLNGFTMLLVGELGRNKIKVYSMCPGWVRTDMGGAGATRSVQQGADTAVWLAAGENIPSGRFYRDRMEVNY